MSFIRKNISLIVLSISLTTIVLSFVYAFLAKDNITFYLKDITGDKDALSDITITGVLQDRFHGQHFEISNGEIKHNFKYYQKAEDAVKPPVKYANGISSDGLVYTFDYDFQIASDATTEVVPNTSTVDGDSYGGETVRRRTVFSDKVEFIADIWVRNEDFTINVDNTRFSIPTGITLISDKLEFEFEEIIETRPDGQEFVTHLSKGGRTSKPYYDSFAKCMTFLNGKLYFTFPTTKEHSGENGIFVVDEFEKSWSFYEWREIGKGRKIVKWSLNDHNTDVLALESVNGKLVLIMAIDDILTLKVYDEHGNFLDEMAFKEIYNCTDTNAGLETYVNEDFLNICIGETSYYGFTRNSALISVQIGDKIIPRQIIHKLDFKDEIAKHYNIHAKGNKVYIVTSLERLDEGNEYVYEPLRHRRLVIMVYEDSQLIYKGELVTDADEDFEMERLKNQVKNRVAGSGGLGHDPFLYRQFYGIELR